MFKFLLFFILLPLPKAWALIPDMNIYMRAGTGTNFQGGGQDCLTNAGSGGNEFRLGNECGIYGEFGFGFQLMKPETVGDPTWRLFSNFAFAYPNQTDYEQPNTQNWILREIYTEGGQVDGLHFVAWAGKRYYRWAYINMMDFFPVDMSGPGGGMGEIELGSGILSAAIIQNSASVEVNGAQSRMTTIGNAAKTSLNLRWEGVGTPYGEWGAWASAAVTPPTTSSDETTHYRSSSGGLIAIKNAAKFEKANHEWGVAYGHGNLSNMSSAGDLVQDCQDGTNPSCTLNQSQRIRAWESLVREGENWSTAFAMIYDDLNRGADNSDVRWVSVGVTPTRWLTDHISVALQAGISNVLDQEDGNGSRNLMRFTVAPQLSMSRGYYARPVLRAYYTRNMWNTANQNSPTVPADLKTATSEDVLGFQSELWF